MAITLSGRLYDPYGNALPDASIRFRAARTGTQIIANYSAEATTDSSGDYTISVRFGTYHIDARQSDSDPWYTIARSIPVTSETTSANVNDLIVAYMGADDATPEIVLEIESIAAQATDAANRAEAAANSTSRTAATIEDMLSLPPGYVADGATCRVVSWRNGWAVKAPFSPLGGGDFVYDASREKSSHNGGTIISPTVPWSSDTRAFINGDGETDASGSGCWVRQYEVLTPEDFGAYVINDIDTESSLDSYMSIQSALVWLGDVGGDLFFRYKYYSKYLLFVLSNTNVYGSGQASEVIFEDPTYSRTRRGGFVIGSTREQNREIGLAKGAAGDYTSAYDDTFAELPLGTYLRDNLGHLQGENSTIHSIRITPRFTSPELTGGYAINMGNVRNCSAWDIWGDGWNELINIGSDIGDDTWSCHNCHAWNLFVEQPDQVVSYYTVGFLANSTSCTIHDAHVNNWSYSEGEWTQTDGLFMRACEDSHFYNIHLNAGSSLIPAATSGVDCRGVMILGGKRCSARGIYCSGLSYAAGVSDSSDSFGPESWDDSNVVDGVYCVNTKNYDVQLDGKYAIVGKVEESESAIATYRVTSNEAQSIKVRGFRRGQTVFATGGVSLSTLMRTDDIEFGRYEERVYQTPACTLAIGTKSLTSLTGDLAQSIYALQSLEDCFAVKSVRAYFTYAGNALSQGSEASVGCYSQQAYSSNTNPLAQYTELARQTTLPTSDSAHDLAISVDVNASLTEIDPDLELIPFAEIDNCSNGCKMKSMRVDGWFYV